jgi:hypothetical protein
MNQIQYAFCAVYMVLSLLLVASIATQDTEDKTISRSGQQGTYFSKNIRKSKEARKERFIKGSAILFAVMNLAAMFVMA